MFVSRVNMNFKGFDVSKNTTNPLSTTSLLSQHASCDSFVKSKNNINSPKNISFEGVRYYGKDGDFVKSLIDKVKCPYRGIKMISSQEISQLDSHILNGDSKTAVKYLKRYEDSMYPIEKNVFHFLEEMSVKSPNKTVHGILKNVRLEYLKDLQKTERKVIMEINKEIKESSFSNKSKRSLFSYLNDCVQRIDINSETASFKRKKFLEEFGELTQKLPENKTHEKELKHLFEIGEKLPSSSEDIGAFIVKYSEVKPKTSKIRTSAEILKRLLMPSQASIEHIHPLSPLEGDGVKGENKMCNYLLTSTLDNNDRGSMPFKDFIKTRPHIKEYLQDYMDAVIKVCMGKDAKGFRLYPLELAKTIKKETNGELVLDTSKFHISKEEAIEELTQRKLRYEQEKEIYKQKIQNKKKNLAPKTEDYANV